MKPMTTTRSVPSVLHPHCDEATGGRAEVGRADFDRFMAPCHEPDSGVPANALWSPALVSVLPYITGEQNSQPGWIKLNTNESPFGPSEKAIAAIQAALSAGLRLYPDPNASALKRTIAHVCEADASQVFVGNGSDEVLAHAFFAFFRQDRRILVPDITYGFYESLFALYGIERRQIALSEDLQIDLTAFNGENGGVIFPNPNAPTGRWLSRGQIEAFLERNRSSVVIVDEAYVDFGVESVIPLVRKYPHLLVVQTFSKSRALAGLRVGFAIGDPRLIKALERVKGSFNAYPLGSLAQAGALAAMADREHLVGVVNATALNRQRLAAALSELGFSVTPSRANFVLARHPKHSGRDLLVRLKERKILVRHFAQPRISDQLRITVGTESQCDALCAALAPLV